MHVCACARVRVPHEFVCPPRSFSKNYKPIILGLMDNVEEEIEAAQRIVQRLEAMDEDIQTSRDFITKQILRDPHLRDELEQVIRSNGKGKVRGLLEGILKG